ncbi:glycosyltransferase family 4 protein [Pseudomonadota bacterium]
MKIGVDIRDCGEQKTGKGWYAFSLLSQLLKIDTKNHYVLYSGTSINPFTKFKDAPNVEHRFIPGKSWKWHLKVLKDIKKSKVGVFFSPSSYIIPAFAPKGLQVIVTIHDLVAFLLPKAHNTKAILIERITLKKALKKVSAVFTVSENTKKDILERFDYPASKIQITPCAPADYYSKTVSSQDIKETRKKHKIPSKFLLAVGTLEPRKNFGNLIKAYVNVKRSYPDYKLVIVGKKGWKFKHIEETVEKYDLKNDVIFPGYLEDKEVRNLYKSAAVFVFPSLYEGFGIPPLEAMSCGCPVVSSNVASLPEVIGEAGLLIDPKNAYRMADAIMSLLESEEIRKKFIERGLVQAKKFTWQDSANKAYEIISNLT